ncbi:MAG: M1 family metallopeptidase [Ignavibacteriae bacterium]|nr:M1 family metallopeptidase [Ignavibacteriota bacterium]
MRIAALLCLISSLVSAQSYWQQDVHYTIDASLDPKEHRIKGKETLVYKNNSPHVLDVAYFRLYWNLFTSGSYGQQLSERNKYYYHDTTGGIWVSKVAVIEDGQELIPQYLIDNTIMEVKLPTPLTPRGSATFVFEFEERVPEGGNRTGHQGRDYNIAQWYPQIATYDKHGWDKSQYLGPAEFYNEYGTFDVSITLPKSFTLGYSGVLLNPEEVYSDSIRQQLKASEGNIETVRVVDYSKKDWKGEDTVMVTWKFHAENVRDFAWSANEHYIWDVTHWSPGLGEPSVTIHALYFEDKAEFWKEAAQYGRHAIDFFSRHFGQYVYPNCFIVEGPEGGGMEYPGITFIGHIGDKNNHSLFGVVTHEVGHNWYPMMIGSNETHYGFMDEGFTTFITALAVEDYYGRYNNEFEWTEWYQNLLCFPNDNEREGIQRGSIFLAKTGYEEPIATHIYRFTEGGLFGGSIYGKTAAVMFMLQYVLGDSLFEAVMKEYYNRWKFKHPYPEDFYAVAMEVSGRDLHWFFDQWFHRTYKCDYGIGRFDYKVEKKNNQPIYKTEFTICRNGQAIMPLDVRIKLADNRDTTIWIPVDRWMNTEAKNEVTVDLPAEPLCAEINPDGRILDMNRLNNTSSMLPKMKWEFDNTLFSVTPIDAFQIKWRASFWYTDEGGWKAGYKFQGSYLNDLYATTVWNWYNFHDRTFNYDLSLAHNFYKLTPLSSASIRWYRIEGRKGVTLSSEKGLRRRYSYPPYHTVRLTYAYSQADNSEYLLYPLTWEEGILHRILVGYEYQNRGKFWNVNAWATLESSTSLFGQSDWDFAKRTFEVRTNLTMPLGWTLALRLYNGVGYGDIPNQTKYYFTNGSPIEQFNAPFFRSKGPLPSTVRDHALYRGGGNMRGYYRFAPAGDKIDAFNAEARFQTLIPFFNVNVPILSRIMNMFKSTLFLDAGRIASNSQKLWDQRFELDFGFGFRLKSLATLFGPFAQSNLFSSIGLQTLRVDFPIYVSMPVPDENKLKFRWVVSLSEAF